MRNDSLEGVRGAAALLVVLYHMSPGGGGYLAVDLFFVLSGYVIGGAYGVSLRDGAAWRAFIVRRFGRLWPAHIVAAVLVYAFVLAVAAAAGNSALSYLPSVADALAIVFLGQGIVLTHEAGVPVAWSTSDEFYVYALFGLVCLMTRGRARIAAFAVLASVGYAIALSASLGAGHCLTRGDCFDLHYGYGWSRCVAGFFAGTLVAEAAQSVRMTRIMRTMRAAQCWTFAAALALLLFAGRLPGSACVAPVVFAALIASLSGDSGPVARLFHIDSAQYLGRISYSLYLAHGVCLVILGCAIQFTGGYAARVVENLLFVVGSFALAHVLNRYVETPCRRHFNAWAETVSRPRANASSSAQAT